MNTIDNSEKFDKSFIFYETFSKYIDTIQSPDEKLKAYEAIIKYGLYQETPEEQSQAVYIALLIAKPIIDANLQRRENGKKGGEYGKNGGRPKKTDTTTENPVGDIEENPIGDISETPNVNDNGNDNRNVKKVNVNVSDNGTVNGTDNSKVNNNVKSNLNGKGDGVCINKADTHPHKDPYKDLFVSTYGIIEDYNGDLNNIDFQALSEAYNKSRKFLQFNPIAKHMDWIVKQYNKIISDYFTDREYKEVMQLRNWGFKADW